MKKIFISGIALLSLIACNGEEKTENKTEKKTETTAVKTESSTKLNQEIKSTEKKVFFKNIQSGDTLTSPVKIEFGVSGMDVMKAGKLVENSGHHHLLIDVDKVDLTSPIPSDEQHKHFGGGQTETSIELKPGNHNLKLLFANGMHVPHSTPLMSEIEVFVK